MITRRLVLSWKIAFLMMEIDYVSLAALLISLSAVSLSIIKFTKESKVRI